MTAKIRLGVLASGRGSNFLAIQETIERGDIDAETVILITNNPDAKALESAKARNIEAVVIESKGLSKEGFDRKVIDTLIDHRVDLVVLAGFMRIIGKAFTDAFPKRIMNIHPALLPSFPGLDIQRQALEYGVKVSGCTVHFVDEGVDTGPIILQSAVPVHDDDTEETLSARILTEEHRIYPEAVRLFAEGKLSVEGRRVIINEGKG